MFQLKSTTSFQDVGDVHALTDFYKKTKEYVINIWINNTGYSIDGPMIEFKEKDLINMINTNSLGATILSNLYVRDYQNVENNYLVNVTSTASYSLVDSLAFYNDTKFFLSGE